ncbi:hypothetical protein Tco_0689775 [Tanacetum coccineum]
MSSPKVSKNDLHPVDVFPVSRPVVKDTSLNTEERAHLTASSLGQSGTKGASITSEGVMDAPTLPVSAERNLGDPIEIRVDIVHPAPVDVFPAATVVRTLAQHGEAIRGIHGHLQGVPINEEMSALRF